jgi:hypothetical protein
MCVILLSCVILLYSLHVLEALRPGRQPKQIKLLYSSVKGHTSAAGHLQGPIYSSVNR